MSRLTSGLLCELHSLFFSSLLFYFMCVRQPPVLLWEGHILWEDLLSSILHYCKCTFACYVTNENSCATLTSPGRWRGGKSHASLQSSDQSLNS